MKQAQAQAELEEDVKEAGAQAKPKVAQPAAAAANEVAAEDAESGEGG